MYILNYYRSVMRDNFLNDSGIFLAMKFVLRLLGIIDNDLQK